MGAFGGRRSAKQNRTPAENCGERERHRSPDREATGALDVGVRFGRHHSRDSRQQEETLGPSTASPLPCGRSPHQHANFLTRCGCSRTQRTPCPAPFVLTPAHGVSSSNLFASAWGRGMSTGAQGVPVPCGQQVSSAQAASSPDPAGCYSASAWITLPVKLAAGTPLYLTPFRASFPLARPRRPRPKSLARGRTACAQTPGTRSSRGARGPPSGRRGSRPPHLAILGAETNDRPSPSAAATSGPTTISEPTPRHLRRDANVGSSPRSRGALTAANTRNVAGTTQSRCRTPEILAGRPRTGAQKGTRTRPPPSSRAPAA